MDYLKSSLLNALKKSPTYNNDHILIIYIDTFDKYLGSAQTYTVDLAHRLGLDYNLERYIYVQDIELREVIYYELLNYILHAEPNLKAKGFPSTETIVNYNSPIKFKPLYDKFNLGKGKKFKHDDYRKRMSLVTDYFMKDGINITKKV